VVELERERDGWKELHAGAHQSWRDIMDQFNASGKRVVELGEALATSKAEFLEQWEGWKRRGARIAELEAQLAGAHEVIDRVAAYCVVRSDGTARRIGQIVSKWTDGAFTPLPPARPEAAHATPHAASQVRSKSVLRREAVQRGEPVPGDGPGPTYLPGFQHPPAPPIDPVPLVGVNQPAGGKGEPGPFVPFERYTPPAPPPEPKGEVCERCGKRGIIVPVTVVPIDGPVGRIDLLCLDCAETPEPREVPGPVAPGGGGAAEPLYQWVPRFDLDAANERARIAEACLAGSYRDDKDFAEAIRVEHQRIEAERDAALASAAAMREAWEGLDAALSDYFDAYGLEHDEGCPEDDTCDCADATALNRADKKFRDALTAAPSDYAARVRAEARAAAIEECRQQVRLIRPIWFGYADAFEDLDRSLAALAAPPSPTKEPTDG
jgi:hypothetical protein